MKINKFKKSVTSLLLTSFLFTMLTVSGVYAHMSSDDIEDEELINQVVACFMPLTKIPRQSHHEEEVSNFLVTWAKQRGFEPIQDEANNVIFDVPGTKGMEKAPVTILQAHMDMVIAVEEGKTFDPQKDGITVINDGITLTADGTSLGADDGMGIATIFSIIDNNDSHGPLRIIFTTNEEDGMTGAFGLTEDKVSGAKYAINIDSENSTEVTNSSAAGTTVHFSMKPEVTKPERKQAYEISISGLLSGHSGLDINKGRLNAITVIGYFLRNLQDDDIDFELSSIIGGSANNAIAAKATACIVIDEDAQTYLKQAVADADEFLNAFFKGFEPNYKLSLKKCNMPEKVFDEKTKENVVIFLSEIHNGVNSMSPYVDGLVESSSNIGLISMDANSEEKSTASTYIRSSDKDILETLTDEQVELAKKCGIKAETARTADPWPVNPDSHLLDLVKDAYLKEDGTEISVVQLHAGLETGTFALLDPNLDIVSIGFDINNPHTIDETCYLQTIPTTYRTLENVLAEIGKETA